MFLSADWWAGIDETKSNGSAESPWRECWGSIASIYHSSLEDGILRSQSADCLLKATEKIQWIKMDAWNGHSNGVLGLYWHNMAWRRSKGEMLAERGDSLWGKKMHSCYYLPLALAPGKAYAGIIRWSLDGEILSLSMAMEVKSPALHERQS